MKKKHLKLLIWISSITLGIGIIMSLFAYNIEDSNIGYITGILFSIIGFIGSFLTLFVLFKEKSQKPVLQLDFQTETKLADNRLVVEINLRNKTIETLKEELSRKDIPPWEQTVRKFLEKGEVQKAIESIDTNASDEEAAQKHIRKAQLFITTFQFPDVFAHSVPPVPAQSVPPVSE